MDPAALRFLVVEDHAFQRTVLVEMLRDLGARHISEAANGRAALQLLEEQPPTSEPLILVCDLDLPEMDGIELLREVAGRKLAQGTILVSARERELAGSVAAMVRASGLTLVGNLRKPISREKLKIALARKLPPSGPPFATADLSPAALRRALETDAIRSVFQPKVDMATGALEAVEVLARMRGEAGPVAPSTFIPAMARHGLLTDLLFRSIDHACTALAAWKAQGLAPRACINVSMDSLLDPGVVDRIVRVIAAHRVPPPQLAFEITETEVMADPTRVLSALSRLRLKGFDLAIDDFGRGYSSLQQLIDIPFTMLKVDQTFISRCTASSHIRRIVQSIIRLTHDLGRQVVAEGVEDRDTWFFLRHERCDEAQGYFIAPPLEAAQLRTWAHAWSAGMPHATHISSGQ